MSDTTLLEPRRRSLTPAEQRLLHARITDLKGRINSGVLTLLPGLGVIGALWLLTLAVADAPWHIVTAFWIVVGGGILLWVRRDQKKDLVTLGHVIASCESALKRNEAEVFDIRSTCFAEFVEVADEGACYAFEIDGPRLVFVSGQIFYPQAKFPSHDFSLVHLLDEDGHPVDWVIEKRGPQMRPKRTLPAVMKLKLDIPEHLTVLAGGLGQIENLLKRTEEGS